MAETRVVTRVAGLGSLFLSSYCGSLYAWLNLAIPDLPDTRERAMTR